MVSWQIKKDTKQKGHESSIGEILDTLQKQQDVCWVSQTKFLHQRRLVWSFLQSFTNFRTNLQTFKNQGK